MNKVFKNISPVYCVMDGILICLSFAVPYFLKYRIFQRQLALADFPFLSEYIFIVCLWMFFIMTGFRRQGLYSTDRALSILKEIWQVIVRVIYASVIISAVIFYSKYKFFSREIFIETCVLLCVLLSGWRVIKRLMLRRLIAHGFHNINVFIVGAGRVGQMIFEEIQANPVWGFKVVGFLDDYKEGNVCGVPIVGNPQDCLALAQRYFVDDIIVTIPDKQTVVHNVMAAARQRHMGVSIIPENFAESVSELTINRMGVIPLLTYKERRRHPSEFALKRIMDVVFSFLALVVLSPVFAVIAVLIKRDSRGPVFYRQQRVGHKGHMFMMYKFRSMVFDADQQRAKLQNLNEVKDGVMFKIKNDPRVTVVGKFLRKHNLDEMPQLWNVLKGDMSMVGPRPPTPDEVDQYKSDQMTRLSIRPGMTCLSQVKGWSDRTFHEWVKLDLWYIKNWSLMLDIQILFWTALVVVNGKGVKKLKGREGRAVG